MVDKGRTAGGLRYTYAPPPPKPGQSFAMISGRAVRPIKYRLRPRLFLGPALEELVEYSDGRQRWERVRWPVEINAEDLPA